MGHSCSLLLKLLVIIKVLFSLDRFEYVPVTLSVSLAQKSEVICYHPCQLVCFLFLLQWIPSVREMIDEKCIIAGILIGEEKELIFQVSVMVGLHQVRLEVTF